MLMLSWEQGDEEKTCSWLFLVLKFWCCVGYNGSQQPNGPVLHGRLLRFDRGRHLHHGRHLRGPASIRSWLVYPFLTFAVKCYIGTLHFSHYFSLSQLCWLEALQEKHLNYRDQCLIELGSSSGRKVFSWQLTVFRCFHLAPQNTNFFETWNE